MAEKFRNHLTLRMRPNSDFMVLDGMDVYFT